MKKQIDWQNTAAKLFCFAAAAVFLYAALKYFFPLLLPLTVAFMLSFCVNKISVRLCAVTGISKRIWAFITLVVIVGGCGALLFFIARLLIGQMSGISERLRNGLLLPSSLLELIREIPLLDTLFEDTESYAQTQLSPLLSGMLSTASAQLGGMISSAIKSAPSVLFSVLVSVLCVYYMSVDLDIICAFVKRYIPESIKCYASGIKDGALYVGIRYLRAYARLFLLTFAELAVGLLIICPRYSLACALMIAAVDILPVFGAGFVLIPWSIICFASGEPAKGVGLLVLYLTVTVVRQIAEPKILGDSIGLHPLGTLLSMYIGFRLFGIVGMLVSPVAVATLRSTLKNRDLQ